MSHTYDTIIANLKRAEKDYYSVVSRVESYIRENVIIPYCDKFGLRFLSGMGTWRFYDGFGNNFGDDEVADCVKYILNFELINQFEIGICNLEDYTSPYYSHYDRSVTFNDDDTENTTMLDALKDFKLP